MLENKFSNQSFISCVFVDYVVISPSPGPPDRLLQPSHSEAEHTLNFGAVFFTTGYLNVIGFCS